jgi:hypothetical protein
MITLTPVALSLYTGLLRRRQHTVKRIIPCALVVTVVAGQLPGFLGAAVAAVCIVLYSLATVPDPSRTRLPQRLGPTAILAAVLALIAVLLTENFLIWVVSATFAPGQRLDTAPPPLQDNGRLLLERLTAGISKRQIVQLRHLWNVQWALVACAGTGFLVVDCYYHPVRQFYSIAARAVLSLAVARSVRTVSFLLTVLPSQVPACYAQRFPSPPPTDAWEWIWVGLLPRSHGGCNDLIVSGHATVTSTLACLACSVADDPLFAASLWSMLIMDYCVEIYEGFHYSVDMWLGMVLVSLIWRAMQPVEGRESIMKSGTETAGAVGQSFKSIGSVSTRWIAAYVTPAAVAYLQLTVLPEFTANFFVVIFFGFAVALYVKLVVRQADPARRQLYLHYVQHVLLFLLYLALGIYL